MLRCFLLRGAQVTRCGGRQADQMFQYDELRGLNRSIECFQAQKQVALVQAGTEG
jgi:hypothetical protein